MAKPSGRHWAYVGALLGALVSVAANVAHSYVPPVGAREGWSPPYGAVFGAIFWPVALLVAVEIMARVDWPEGGRWIAVRSFLVPVALVAAVVSYRHMSGLLAFYREDPLTVAIGPLAVDGLMVLATGALIATSGVRAREEVAPPRPTAVPEAKLPEAKLNGIALAPVALPSLPRAIAPEVAPDIASDVEVLRVEAMSSGFVPSRAEAMTLLGCGAKRAEAAVRALCAEANLVPTRGRRTAWPVSQSMP